METYRVNPLLFQETVLKKKREKSRRDIIYVVDLCIISVEVII